MTKVAIVTDSTTAIPPEIAAEKNMTIVPLYVNWDGKSYLDGIEIKLEDFYKRLETSKSLPTTSQPSASAFNDVYENLLSKGYDILTIVISSKLSGTFDSAEQALANFPGQNIRLIDSLQASIPLSLVSLAAADAASQGCSLLECANLAEDYSRRVRTLFLVETLEYLHRGGRIGAAAKLLGTALSLKPILEIKDGFVSTFEKVRTTGKALDRIVAVAEAELAPHRTIEYFGVATANAPELGQQMMEAARERFTINNEFVGMLSPVIGVHTGPGALGFVYLPAK